MNFELIKTFLCFSPGFIVCSIFMYAYFVNPWLRKRRINNRRKRIQRQEPLIETYNGIVFENGKIKMTNV